jgi:hypothetical protein
MNQAVYLDHRYTFVAVSTNITDDTAECFHAAFMSYYADCQRFSSRRYLKFRMGDQYPCSCGRDGEQLSIT